MKGHIRQRGKRSWELKYDVGRDRRTGKREIAYVTFCGGRREAQTELSRLITEAKQGRRIKPSKLTVAEYLDQWLVSVKSSMSPKSYDWLDYIIRVHLAPGLGDIPLQDLEPIDIQTFYTRLLENGRQDGKKGGLSRCTVRSVHKVLRQSLQQAVGWSMIASNPAAREFVKPPKAEHREIKVLTPAQIAALLKQARSTRWYMPILLAATTGMRRGEILALRWSDVELDQAKLTVNQSRESTKGAPRFKAPKTRSSRRQITLPTLAVEALRKHRAEQRWRHRMLDPNHKPELVFTNPDGTSIYPSRFTENFTAIAKRAGFTCTLHGLRHSHASQLLRDGVPVTAVAQRLGHANSATTLGIYAHLLPGMEHVAAERTDAALRDALET